MSDLMEELGVIAGYAEERQNVDEWECAKDSYDNEVGIYFEGRPEISVFEPRDGKNYHNIRFRLLDDINREYADFYITVPNSDDKGFIHNLRKNFDFYRSGFDVIFSYLKLQNPVNVITDTGDEINKFASFNMDRFIELLKTYSLIGMKVTEGNPDNDEYNSCMIIKTE